MGKKTAREKAAMRLDGLREGDPTRYAMLVGWDRWRGENPGKTWSDYCDAKISAFALHWESRRNSPLRSQTPESIAAREEALRKKLEKLQEKKARLANGAGSVA